MKILVISDSHGRLEKLISVYEREKSDMVICAGDFSDDAEELSYVFPENIYHIVKGNCDYYDMQRSDEMILELGGHKVFLAHGHHYRVKLEYETIEKRGRELGCDVVIFGHTHRPYLEKKKGITLFNPGAVLGNDYGIIKINKESIDFLLKRI